MLRRKCLVLLAAGVIYSFASGSAYGFESTAALLAQAGRTIAQADLTPTDGAPSTVNLNPDSPGAYLSWKKLLLVAIAFLIWVRLADWINRDSMKIGKQTELPPEIWNPITVGSFLLGFLIVLFVPIFPLGYAIFLLAALTPFLVYFFMRRSQLKSSPEIAHQLKGKPGSAPPAAILPQDQGANVEFMPAGRDNQEQQVNLIRARQSNGFPLLKDLIADALFKRADTILLDYARDKVGGRLQVDGAWHPIPPLDRQNGDALLVSLKSLAGLSAAERRAKQSGQFSLKTESEKAGIELLTQGVPTGERAQIKFIRKKKTIMPLGQLGMFPEMVERIKTSLNSQGLVIVSAYPGEGLTSTWQGALTSSDRLTRDCVAILAETETDTTVENIAIRRYDTNAGKKQIDILKGTLLSQPDFVACPEIEDSEAMDLLSLQAVSNSRTILTQTPAKSASEALLRMYAKAGDRDQFARSVKHVTGQRLIRRLCDQCKQEVRVPPKTIQQLGGDPKKIPVLYRQYQLPPPEQRVDEKGKPIEFPPCPACGGIGYIGRIGVFEMIEVSDKVRVALKLTPQVEAIESAATAAGKVPIVKQAYKLVLLGITSLAEVQRVFK